MGLGTRAQDRRSPYGAGGTLVVCALLVGVACGEEATRKDRHAASGGASGGGPDASSPSADGSAGRPEPMPSAGGSAGASASGSGGSKPDSGPEAGSESGADAPVDSGAPVELVSDTGLYADPIVETLAPGVSEYEVRFQLWADGATKRRFLYLPPGKTIDTSDMDAWRFPIGTKAWKEFTRDGVRVETRLLEKTADGPDGWKHLAFAWNPTQTRAEAVPLGVEGALGTPHDIPDQGACFACHSGSPDFLIGVSAMGLPYDGAGVTLTSLTEDGRLTDAVAPDAVAIPGDAAAQKALGTLHANCGHCHRPGTLAFERTALELRLKVGAGTTVEQTPAYTTTVGIPTSRIFDGVPLRITAGVPAESAIYTRMASRETDVAMPPIASKLVDKVAAKSVSDWIDGLARD